MPTSARQYSHISPEQYLAENNDGQWRHEYVDGVVYPMPERDIRHNLVSSAIIALLTSGNGDWQVFSGDFKLRVKTSDGDRSSVVQLVL